MKVVQHLACRDPGSAKCAGTQTASTAGVMALSLPFFEPLVAGDQKASGYSFCTVPPVQALRGLPCLGSLSVVHHVRNIEGSLRLGSYPVDQCIRHLKGHYGWSPTL